MNFNLALTFFITEFPIDEKDILLSNVNPKYVIFDLASMATLSQEMYKRSVLASRILEAIRMLSVLLWIAYFLPTILSYSITLPFQLLLVTVAMRYH